MDKDKLYSSVKAFIKDEIEFFSVFNFSYIYEDNIDQSISFILSLYRENIDKFLDFIQSKEDDFNFYLKYTEDIRYYKYGLLYFIVNQDSDRSNEFKNYFNVFIENENLENQSIDYILKIYSVSHEGDNNYNLYKIVCPDSNKEIYNRREWIAKDIFEEMKIVEIYIIKAVSKKILDYLNEKYPDFKTLKEINKKY